MSMRAVAAVREAGEGQTDDQTPSSSPVPASETGPFAQKPRVPSPQVPASLQCGPLRNQERRGLRVRMSLADGKRVLRHICPDPAPPHQPHLRHCPPPVSRPRHPSCSTG